MDKFYRILVAEDDDFQRVMLDKMLSQCEYEAITVQNGKLAMEILKSGQHFDLMLLDLYMPEMDGF